MLLCFSWGGGGGIGGCQKPLGRAEKFASFMVDVLKNVFILVKSIAVLTIESCCAVNHPTYDWAHKGSVSLFTTIT